MAWKTGKGGEHSSRLHLIPIANRIAAAVAIVADQMSPRRASYASLTLNTSRAEVGAQLPSEFAALHVATLSFQSIPRRGPHRLGTRPDAAGPPTVFGAKGGEMVEEGTSVRRQTDLHQSTKMIAHTLIRQRSGSMAATIDAHER